MPRIKYRIRNELNSSVIINPDSIKTPLMRQVELRMKVPLEVYFIRQLKKHSTLEVMANEIGIDISVVSRWMRRLRVVKPVGEA